MTEFQKESEGSIALVYASIDLGAKQVFRTGDGSTSFCEDSKSDKRDLASNYNAIEDGVTSRVGIEDVPISVVRFAIHAERFSTEPTVV